MQNAQTFATYSFGLNVLEFPRFLKQFRITANACYNEFGFLPELAANIQKRVQHQNALVFFLFLSRKTNEYPMSHYNPEIHHRRSIRLKGYDYASEGLYFVTICTQNRECLFGEIKTTK